MAPSVRALDTVDDVVAGDPPKARAPQPAPVSTAVAPTKAPAPSSAPSPVVGKAPDVPKAPAAVSAPPRPAPAVSIAQVPATQPAVDPMGSRRSEVQAPVVAQKRVPEQNVPAQAPAAVPAAELPMSPAPVRQPVVQSRPAMNQMPPVRVAAVRPPVAPTTTTAAETSQQLAMISNRAGEHIEYAFNLAERGPCTRPKRNSRRAWC